LSQGRRDVITSLRPCDNSRSACCDHRTAHTPVTSRL